MKFDILDRSLDVFQTRFLEASAGTGKTFAIEHLYVRLLIEGSLPLTVSQILVVTFTKAATRELKMRIRSNIEKALTSLEMGDTDLDYLKQQLDVGPKRAIFCLKNALAFADEMQIFTIHGFCYRMLSEHAFEAEESMELADPDESTHKGSLVNVVKDYFRTAFDPKKYSGVQLHHLLKKHRYDFSKLTSSIVSLVEKGVSIDEIDCFETLFKRFQGQIAQLPQIEKEKFLEDFQKLSSCYKQMTDPSFQTQGMLLGTILESKNCSHVEFDLLLKDKVIFLEKIKDSNLKVRAKKFEFHYEGLFETLRDQVLPLLNHGKDPALLGMRVARNCQIRWEEKKSKSLPDELLKKMSKCLDNPLFAKKGEQKYFAAIIDEFQDTDPVQWDILERLFLQKTKAFYLVGDPKQSIYAFRNADIRTYRQAKTKIEPGKQAFLDTNYRSDPELVHALNQLFLFTPTWLSNLDVKAVSSGKKETIALPDEEKGRVHFFIAKANKSRSENWPTAQMEEALFLPFITQEIQNVKNLGTCAILVKDRFQAKRVQEFLKKFNIKSAVKRSESLLDSNAYIAIRDLLFAVRNPKDFSLIKRALAGPLFGWSAEEMIHILQDPRFEKIKTLFHCWHQLFMDHGFGQMMGSFFTHCPLEKSWANAFRQWVELLLSVNQDPFCFLEELEREDAEEESTLVLREEDDEDKILIMTTHVSKGLEFDFVFALGTAFRHLKNEEYVKIANKLVKFDENLPACQEVLQEREEEKLRQFYVALTRAKQRVYIALGYDLEGSPANSPCELFFEKQGLDAFQTLNSLKEKALISYSILEEGSFNLEIQEEEKLEECSSLPEVQVSGAPCFLNSFSSLAQKQPQESIEITEDCLPPGAETGHILHKIIEKAFSSSCDLMKSIQEEVMSTPLVGWEAKIFEMLSPIFDLPLEVQKGKFIILKDLPKEKIFQEMEFLFSREGNRTKGFIDLIFLYEDKYYFIDWKSNWLSEYSPDALEKAMHSFDYFLQASIYAEALKRYFSHFSLKCGGAFYVFLRGSAVYTLSPEVLCSSIIS
jgi:exodeoxyribonuclease V beta subunit